MRWRRISASVVAATLCLAVHARSEDVDTPSPRLDEVLVEARRPLSAASSEEIRARDYRLRPHSTVFQILNNLPGVFAAQHQGGSKAPQWFLRGFDADHGTDVAVFQDMLPVNFPSHAHGQGYADTAFIIPETIDYIQLFKGPYFPQFGDFANAGVINFVTLDEFPENFVLAEGGSFDTQRYVIGGSPKIGAAKTLLAAQARYTNGPFVNPENLASYNAYGKVTWEPTPDSRLWLSATGYQSDWDASGQIPLRLVSEGKLDRFGSLDPTEGGRSERENVDLHYRWTPSPADTVKLQAYASRYKLRLWSDFTFFKASGLRFVRLPNGTVIDTGDGPVRPGAKYVPGDGIYQGDARWLAGGRGSYTRTWFLRDIPLQSEVGLETRNDTADVTLQRQVRRQSFSRVNDVRIEETSFSGYVSQQVFPAEWVRFEAGFRGDYFLFDVNDRLPAQRPDPNFSSQAIDGRSGDGVLSPKANLVFTPLLNTDIYLNFGEGFHSNDARAVILGKNFSPGTAGGVSPSAVSGLAKSLGYELGARTRQFDKLDIAAALWLIDLDSELVFSGDAGSDEASPQTRRWGIDFETRYQILRWLSVDYDLSFADPRFRGEEAIAEAGGSAIPLAPTLYMNGGITAELPYGFSVGLRGRYLDDRPANEDRTLVARGFFLLDLVGRYRWRNLELSLQMLNLTNTDWREAQFADNSCVRSEQQGVDSGRPCFNKPGRNAVEPPADIHFTPGSPFGVYAGLKVFFP